MKKTVIVSFANHIGRYAQMLKRLEQSLNLVGYDGDTMFFHHEEQINLSCPYHKSDDLGLVAAGRVVPYAFKAWAIKKAVDAGYENIIWMDSAVYATKDLRPFIEYIEKNGVAFFDNIGFSIGDYTSDACLKQFEMSRTEAFESPMIMACLMGFNMKSLKAKLFIDKYFEAAQDGVSYHGSWHNNNGEVSSDLRVKGTRHDQSVASIIIKQMDLPILNAQDTFFAYDEHKSRLKISDSVCLWSAGL